MRAIRFSAISAAVVAAIISAATAPAQVGQGPADPKVAAQREAKLIAVLTSNATGAEKALACKRLAICGTEKAVPALAPLLSDPQLAAWARTALEAIPGAAVDAALRDAAGRLQGRLAIGAFTSISVRRDTQAVYLLAARLRDADVEVAAAAAVALGRLGGDRAAAAVQGELSAKAPALRSAAAEGCILCAEHALADRNAAEAIRLYDAARAADVPIQRVLEATRGAILARGDAGLPLLLAQLGSSDAKRFALGLRMARELPGRKVTEALVGQLGTLPADRGKLLVVALADRGDRTALPAILAASKGGTPESRAAALTVLGRLGDASCVPALLEAAVSPHKVLAETAADVLRELPGQDVDNALAARLSGANGALRGVLIQLAGRRNIAAAVPALVAATNDSDGRIRTSALEALGYSAQSDDLPVLIGRVTNPPADVLEKDAAEKALRAACQRMPDREACAGKLIAAMPGAPAAAERKLLEILAAVGGAKALEAVGAAARSNNAPLQDTATELLGKWMSVDAGPVLLELARSTADAKHHTRAVRGYIRLAKQFVMPDAQRAAMCRNALAIAKRDEERELLLGAMVAHPSLDMLRLSVEIGKTPSLKDSASQAALRIAQKLGTPSADVAKLLAQVGQKPVKIEILKAEYGAAGQWKDVTESLKAHVGDMPLVVLPSSNYNAALGGDPAPNVVKQLKVRYRLDGKEGKAAFVENATIMLPTPR